MTTTRRPLRRSTSIGALGLLVLAVLLGSVGLVAPAQAAPAAPALPASPLAATLATSTPSVVTGGTVRLTGTSPALGALAAPLQPVPVLDVAIQRKAPGAAEFTEVGRVTPAGDGTFSYSVKQARSAQYRAVPLAPVGGILVGVLPQLVASDSVAVASRGTVSLASKRVARRTYTFSGVAAPVVKGQLVTLQVKKGKTFRTVAATRTVATGAWSAKVKLAKGKRTVRVVTARTADAAAAATTRVVRIR